MANFKGSTTILVVPTEDIEFSGLTIPRLAYESRAVYDGIRVLASADKGLGGGYIGSKQKQTVAIKRLRDLADWLEKMNNDR